MTAAKALILGLIQGIAEFLPISSSGHLAIFKDILDLEEIPLLFDVILHLATLLAVVIVLRKRIIAILTALWDFFARGAPKVSRAASEVKTPVGSKKELAEAQTRAQNLGYVLPILVATAVTGILGYGIQKFIPMGGTRAVATRLLFTAIILGLTAIMRPGTRGPDAIGWKRGAFIGFAQGIGVFSGISRSGITISAGLFSGLNRETAGELSFLLSIPAILGAFLLTVKDAGAMMGAVSYSHLALSAFAALISGIFSLKILLKIIKGGKLFWFAPYLVIVGILGLILS